MTSKLSKAPATAAKLEEPTMRVTRASAKSLVSSNGVASVSESSFKQDERLDGGVSLKRAAAEEMKPKMGIAGVSSGQNKRRAVMKDISNLVFKNAPACTEKVQMRKPRAPQKKNAKALLPTTSKTPLLSVDESQPKVPCTGHYKITFQNKYFADPKFEGSTNPGFPFLTKCCVSKAAASLKSFSTEVNSEICDDLEVSNKLTVTDIDLKQKDPKWCSMYAFEIYNHLRILELECRPTDSYMETIQKDITQGMRAILIDWLAEVSEEYKLVPDTLYLTVNLIDRYLSLSYIERNKLQLLGVTCMLIASKYEEICSPHVEEFCFVTDNTYSKHQVLEMERRVLNLLCFRLSVPTIKSFVRRFVRAAQACDEDHAAELELLANYLAELSLMEYSFVKLLPSLIAASAVFLARWTIDQSDDPWNPTLEYHTNYKASQLKSTVIEMQRLQLNINACPLNVIREKYKLQKFKCVATFVPAKPVESLF